MKISSQTNFTLKSGTLQYLRQLRAFGDMSLPLKAIKHPFYSNPFSSKEGRDGSLVSVSKELKFLLRRSSTICAATGIQFKIYPCSSSTSGRFVEDRREKVEVLPSMSCRIILIPIRSCLNSRSLAAHLRTPITW